MSELADESARKREALKPERLLHERGPVVSRFGGASGPHVRIYIYLKGPSSRAGVARRTLLILGQMRRTANHGIAQRAAIVRRVLTAVLVATYLIVGFGGEISCAEESLTTEASFDVSAVQDKADQDSKKAATVVEHCYTCIPLTIPAAVQIALPVSVSVGLSFPSDPIILVEKRLLDPPPPKSLT